jgi:PEP-CTERM motif-containing protein
MNKFKLSGITMMVGLALAANSRAAVYINDDFNTFANGNLVGQNGWNQLGASSTLPLQVNNGVVVIPGAQTADNQDAWKNIDSGIPQPASGTRTIYAAFSLAVQSAPVVPGSFVSPSYFVAMTTITNGGGFGNFRLAAEDNGGGTFILGARVTGQATDPFTFGGALTYGTVNEVVIEANMVPGTSGASMRVFINPTDTSTPYLTHPMGAGASNPTGIGSFNISQFASATVGNSGVRIDHLVVADTFFEAVPEPTTAVLIGMGLLGALIGRQRV